MKDEYKILIGAVVVILIILVGAFALSGSNNAGPSATPTVIPVTTTPTVAPAGNGEANGGTPSINPTVAPTVAPTVVPPSPTPESGVKQTEFGYWITYPPLGPENWSSPKPKPGNIVYFDPTSASITSIVMPSAISRIPDAIAVLHRSGDLSGMANVTVDVSDNDYMDGWHFSNVANPADIWHANVTFNPGVDSVAIGIYVNQHHVNPIPGLLMLTITDADGGYSFDDRKTFTLSVGTESPPEVDFTDGYGSLWYTDGEFGSDGLQIDDSSGSMVNVTFGIRRSGDPSGPLTVNFYWMDSPGLGTSKVDIYPFTFAAGSSEGLLKVGISKDIITGGYSNELYIYVNGGAGYAPGPNNPYDIYIDEAPN